MKRGFVIHHNGPEANCIGQPHDRCERFWNAVKSYHMNTRGWSDIAYSFGVCPHGIRFTGRGWYKNQFANGADVVGADDGADSYWYTVIVFIGTGEAPTDAMVNGVRALIAEGRQADHCDDRVLPHNAFKVKACPGPEFTAFAAAWDNNVLVAPTPTGGLTMAEVDDILAKLDNVEFLSRVAVLSLEGDDAKLAELGRARGSLRNLVKSLLDGAAIQATVSAAVAKAVAGGTAVDPEAVAAEVIAQIKEKL